MTDKDPEEIAEQYDTGFGTSMVPDADLETILAGFDALGVEFYVTDERDAVFFNHHDPEGDDE